MSRLDYIDMESPPLMSLDSVGRSSSGARWLLLQVTTADRLAGLFE